MLPRSPGRHPAPSLSNETGASIDDQPRSSGMRMGHAAAIASCVALGIAPVVRADDIETSHGALLGATVIHWSGIKGITLDTDRDRLTMGFRKQIEISTTGSYAQAVLVPRNQIINCALISEANCYAINVFYVRDLEPYPIAGADPQDGTLNVASEPIDVYLFSDGDATLTLRPEGVDGEVAYSPTGTVAGKSERLPTFCPTAACDPSSGYAGAYAFGGDSFDVGDLGYASVLSYATSEPTDQSQHARACLYPTPPN